MSPQGASCSHLAKSWDSDFAVVLENLSVDVTTNSSMVGTMRVMDYCSLYNPWHSGDTHDCLILKGLQLLPLW